MIYDIHCKCIFDVCVLLDQIAYIWHLPTNILIKLLRCNPIHNIILSRYVDGDVYVYHGVTLLCVCTVSMGIVCVGVCCECKCCVGFV